MSVRLTIHVTASPVECWSRLEQLLPGTDKEHWAAAAWLPGLKRVTLRGSSSRFLSCLEYRYPRFPFPPQLVGHVTPSAEGSTVAVRIGIRLWAILLPAVFGAVVGVVAELQGDIGLGFVILGVLGSVAMWMTDVGTKRSNPQVKFLIQRLERALTLCGRLPMSPVPTTA